MRLALPAMTPPTWRRCGVVLALALVSLLTVVAPAGARTKAPPPAHQTLRTIAASVAQARVHDAKARATAPASSADVAALQASAAATVAKANAGVQAAEANHDTGLWGDVATLYAATATQLAANQVAADLTAPPPPPPTTTTTTAPVTTTTSTTPATTTTTTQPNAPPPGVLGLYVGSVQSATSLGKTLGLNPLNGYSYYCDGSSWQSIAACGPVGGLAPGATQLVGVNLTPGGTGLSAVAANLGTFTTLASHFVGTNVVFRVGWEFDGNWFPWGNGVNGNTPAQYAAATALVLPAMKAADPAARFDFSDNTGTSTLAQLKTYMGNNAALWTYVGGDHYDDKGSTTGGTMSAMTATVTLASQLNKPLSLGEWGLHNSDDVAFINNMATVILHSATASAKWGWPSYSVGPTSYFSAALQINSDITQFPNSAAAFRADFAPA